MVCPQQMVLLCYHLKFSQKCHKSGAAEIAPKDIPGECWYLPLFGVYHPRKPDQIKGVFDSSAIFEGVSLNSLLCPERILLSRI
jgi:hypothetical protein